SFDHVEPTPLPPGARQLFVGSAGNLTIFNRWHYPESEQTGFFVRPLDEMRNHLIFIHSLRGNHLYYVARNSSEISMFQMEPDPMNRGAVFAGLGRYLLLEVVNPTPRLRVLVSLTASLAADGSLPEGAVVGDSRQPLPFEGRGAAQVFSAPLEPQEIAGRHYLALDLGEKRFSFRPRLTGLRKAWGTNLQADRRQLTAFGRDVSVVTEEEYASLRTAPLVRQFPDDLRLPNLEFSGIYEDGWVAEAAWF